MLKSFPVAFATAACVTKLPPDSAVGPACFLQFSLRLATTLSTRWW